MKYPDKPLFVDFRPAVRKFSLKNAYLLAEASKLAYRVPATVTRQTRAWGLPESRFFDNEGSQGFVAANDELILVAFRGTEAKRIEDWLANIDFVQERGFGGKVHSGFKEALEKIWPGDDGVAATVRELRRTGGQPVWVTGHSLGGALAGLATAASKGQRIPVQGCYTYGMPRLGNVAFAEKFDREHRDRTFRFVNNNDTVPRMPPIEPISYRHVGILKYLDVNGGVRTGGSYWSRVRDRAAGRIKDLFDPGTDGLKDHRIKRYVDILQARADD